jgi:uncharacterized membrane protein
MNTRDDMMVRKIVIISIMCMLFASLFVSTVSGLGMANLNLGDVEQGKTYDITAVVFQSHLDFDNHFIMEKGGELADWISVSPLEFDLAKSESKDIRVILKVPEDAKLGEYHGTITAVGQKTVPSEGGEGGTTIGFRVAAESKIYAKVVKPGAVEAVSILSVIAPKRVEPGSVAKFDVSIKNIGNVPTTASPTLTVSKGAETVATIPGVAIELKVEEEKTAKLYWDAHEKGTYTVVVAVTCGETRTTSEPISIKVGGSTLPLAFVIVTAILVAVIVILAVVQRRKR